MAKQQTFADKAAKVGMMKGAKCPVCGAIYQPILMVSSERPGKSRVWKFNERRVQVCKCNEKQIYG